MTMSAQPQAIEMPLDTKVAFLRQPTSYPESAYRVEAIETHMSWVFLTDGFAYKLKKPVHYDFLDFSSIASRQYFCEEEVRLNRRLTSDVYLGTVPLSTDAQGHLQLDAPGIVIDWLVKMRRLPTQRMLDYAILHHDATTDAMRRIAQRLAAFYQNCVSVNIEPAIYRDTLLRHIDEAEAGLLRAEYALPAAHIRQISQRLHISLEVLWPKISARIAAGKIVEGHGDMRPEHICIKQEIQIIDCLEFSRDLRIVDPIDEIGFLALECERLGAGLLGGALIQDYRDLSGDQADQAIVEFYQSYRASMRARIAIRHLDEEKFRHSPGWRQRALDYLRLAIRHQDSIKAVTESPE